MDTQGLLKKILDDYNSFFHDKDPERTSLERTKSFIYKYFFKEKQREIVKYTERKIDFFGGVNAINPTDFIRETFFPEPFAIVQKINLSTVWTYL